MTAALPKIQRAPIITDASEDSKFELMLYIDSLESNSNIRQAEAESARLSDYFNAMSRYLGKAFDENRGHYSTATRQNLGKLITPAALCGIYNGMAAQMRNTFLTDVTVMTEKAQKYFIPFMGFQEDYDSRAYGRGMQFHFGFKQATQSRKGAPLSCTAFPILTLDDYAVQAAVTCNAKPLLEKLQRLMTLANHDALHHLTAPMIPRDDLVHRFAPLTDRSLNIWAQNIPDYEDWAQIAHEAVILQDPAMVEKIGTLLEDYFADVKNLGTALVQELRGSAESKRAGATQVTEYYTAVAGHILSRLMPLNHPVMQDYLRLAADACPAPEQVHRIPANVFHYETQKKGITTHNIVNAYARNGLDFNLPKDTPCMTVDMSRLFRLVMMSPTDVAPHTPGGTRANPRKNCGRNLLDMVGAAAQMTRFNP